MNSGVKVFAPASVANVACGFDVLGFALNEPGDEIIARFSDNPGFNISKITGDNGKLPLDISKTLLVLQDLSYWNFWTNKEELKLKFIKRCHLEVAWVQVLQVLLQALWQSMNF